MDSACPSDSIVQTINGNQCSVWKKIWLNKCLFLRIFPCQKHETTVGGEVYQGDEEGGGGVRNVH